jgi:predicted ABC-type ATPase
MSRLRVAERVAHGGHAIAPEDIERRFPRSLRNLLDVYAGAVDHTRCFLKRLCARYTVRPAWREQNDPESIGFYDDPVKEAQA